jgi:CRISPR-associated exonuclease Cas4
MNQNLFLLAIAILCLLGAVLLFLLARRKGKLTGMPTGRVVSTDTATWRKMEKSLFDASLGLTGRPDYIVSRGKLYLPVEVKSSPAPSTPYRSHVFQLAMYCLLVCKTYGRRPSHGILHYPGRNFEVEFTPALEADARSLLEEMRSRDSLAGVNRSHDEKRRCLSCGYRAACDQRLA